MEDTASEEGQQNQLNQHTATPDRDLYFFLNMEDVDAFDQKDQEKAPKIHNESVPDKTTYKNEG